MPEQPNASSARLVRARDSHREAQIDALVAGRNPDPFAVLGPHAVSALTGYGLTVSFFRPHAADAWLVLQDGSEPIPARKVRPEGFFEARLPDSQQNQPAPASYRIRFRTSSRETVETFDAYAFPCLLSEFDLHLMGEGRHYDTYKKLGAHPKTFEGVRGVHFAVWAPSAQRVSIVGDFNRWDGRVHPMRARGSSGIWEFFVPELAEGAVYKYEIIGPNGAMLPLKADPYAFCAELRPNTGSVVANLDAYQWTDADWMNQRAREKNWLESPISVYEVHLGSWRRVPEEKNRWLTYRELANQLIPYVKDLGYTHIELLPDHGASLRWLLGLPNHWLFCRHQPLRLPC